MNHWASRYVGAPYSRGASGPDAFSCWGLVRHVFLHVHGVAFEDLKIDEASPASSLNARAILACARAASMRPMPAGTRPQDGDIVILRSLVRLHCGMVVRLNGGLRILHAAHDRGVVVDHWRDGVEGMTWELWRQQA